MIIADVKVGDIVSYRMPSDEVGRGVVGEVREGRLVKAPIVYVEVEERHRNQAPFVVTNGHARVSWGGNGTHRAFNAFQVFKENA